MSRHGQALVVKVDELKKRMQGKSCFNFTSVDEGLFQELAALTGKGFDELRRRELV
jgi:hypothetical protein